MNMLNESSPDDLMSEINMTPFVDVMLVLLIIFLVTLPLVHQTVNIELPKVAHTKLVEHSEPLKISVNPEGHYRLGKEVIQLEALLLKLSTESQRQPKPVILLYADKKTRYEDIAKLLAIIHQSGLGKVGFVTEE
jgi:biopolymer transport protein ExbD